MIAFLTALSSPVLLAKASSRADASPDIGEAILAQFRQLKADWGGSPDIAEQIHRIVNSSSVS